MASATLKLTIDPATGRRTVTIAYASDEDALPHEHEEAHRALVEKIFERGLAAPGDEIVIGREGSGEATDLRRDGEVEGAKVREGA